MVPDQRVNHPKKMLKHWIIRQNICYFAVHFLIKILIMRIIVAGAGEVGSHLAKMLSNENHDILLIDNDEDKLRNIGSLYDLMTVKGSATSISLLKDASINRIDLFIGVTQKEEINITSSILCKKLGAAKTIARIDNPEYLMPANRGIFNSLGIDYMIYPEMIAANEVVGLLQQSGATDVVDFSGGKLSMYVVKLSEDAPVINMTLAELTQKDKPLEYRAVAITRNGKTIIPRGNDRFLPEDHVYVISNKAGLDEMLKYSGKKNFEINNVMILGGSRIGKRTAEQIGRQHNVKLIEINREKAYALSNILGNTLVINGDGSNIDLLIQEGLPKMDAFIAVTGNSETNVLSCVLAKQMGVKKTIAEVENIDYIKLAENMGIDTIINKKLITASRIFRFTMTGDVAAIKCLTGTEAEVMEFVVKPGAPITDGVLQNTEFPKEAIIGGIIRGKSSFIAKGDTHIRPNDKVVVFALPSAIPKMAKYFN
jgi:trk system potassium uptake protein TrkA